MTSLRSVFSMRRLQKGWKKSEALAEEWMADIERDGSLLKKPKPRLQDRSSSHRGSASEDHTYDKGHVRRQVSYYSLQAASTASSRSAAEERRATERPRQAHDSVHRSTTQSNASERGFPGARRPGDVLDTRSITTAPQARSNSRSVRSLQEEIEIPGAWRLSWETAGHEAFDPEFSKAAQRYAKQLGAPKERDRIFEEVETAQHAALDREWWEAVRQNRRRREQQDPIERWMDETQLARAISILGEGDLHVVQERAWLDIWPENDLQAANTTNRAQRTQARDRDCVVCGDAKNALSFPAKPPTASCQHEPQTCSDCLAHWISSEVDTKGTGNIKCCECPALLTHTDVQRAATPATFATYDKRVTREALGSLPNFVWCLSPTCGAGQENSAGANFMECMSCGYRQCLSHRIPWHEEETCEMYEYRMSGRQARDEKQKRQNEVRFKVVG